MYEAAHKYLSERGIRPSLQRMAVVDYLMTHKTHPCADEIYAALVSAIPTLSRTTVYNTVSMLTERGAILALAIDSGKVHYEGDTTPHAHFICTRCGVIGDIFPENPNDWHRMLATAPPPAEVHVVDTQLSYKGLCAECNRQQPNNNR